MKRWNTLKIALSFFSVWGRRLWWWCDYAMTFMLRRVQLSQTLSMCPLQMKTERLRTRWSQKWAKSSKWHVEVKLGLYTKNDLHQVTFTIECGAWGKVRWSQKLLNISCCIFVSCVTLWTKPTKPTRPIRSSLSPPGTRGKCIRTERSWLTPIEFLKEASSQRGFWKKMILCEGKPLCALIEV